MTIKSKLKTFFFLDDEFDDSNDDDETEAVEPLRHKKQSLKSPNVVSLQTVQKSANSSGPVKPSKVMLLEPRTYSEAPDIADHLKNRRAVVVNLQRTDTEQARQIVDFLSGAVYALGGDIQKIGISIFLCTPDNVEVSGIISDLIPDHDQPNARW